MDFDSKEAIRMTIFALRLSVLSVKAGLNFQREVCVEGGSHMTYMQMRCSETELAVHMKGLTMSYLATGDLNEQHLKKQTNTLAPPNVKDLRKQTCSAKVKPMRIPAPMQLCFSFTSVA